MDLRRCRNGYFTFNKNAECLISQRTIADCSVQTTLQCAKENTVQCARGPTWAHIRRARRDTYSIHLIALAHRVLLYLKTKKNANKRTQRDRLRSTQILIPFWLVPNNNNNNERFCSPVCHRVVVRILTLRSSFYWAYRFACCHGKTLQNKFRLTLALAILLQRPTP